MSNKWNLSSERLFDPNPAQRQIAVELFDKVKDLPIVSPHGHVPASLLSDPKGELGSPADLLIIPDHYVFRMFYSRGIALEDLGVPTRDGTPIQTDHRKIWQLFAENFYLFRATPTGVWLADELINVFGVDKKLDGDSAGEIYDYLEKQLAKPEFKPRALFKRFNIETLCTTDNPWDSLDEHRSLHAEGLTSIRPTFRPDGVANLEAPGWSENMAKLAATTGTEIGDYATFIRVLEECRAFFKRLGATSTDQGALTAYTGRLSEREADDIFRRALKGQLQPGDTARFTGHMFMEMARMSTEDGLVMQMHIGSSRNHNEALFDRFGTDKGADIPLNTEWTGNLRPLLNVYGNDPRLRLILFGLDEGNYSRELAPLAGHYPAVLLGPPWWFFDSFNGMVRYLDAVVETAGWYNLVGFNNDTRAFVSIPARHDVWRRVTSNWLAGQVVRGLIDRQEASEMAYDTAYRLPKAAYKLDK